MSKNNRPCNYCGTILARFQKQPDGKWKRWDDKGNEHTYQACKAIQNNKSKGVDMPPPTTVSSGQSAFKTDTEPEVRGVTINSLFVKTSNLEKELKDLRKQIETLETIADGIAQNVTLLVQNNYPKPERLEDKMGEPTYIDKDGTKHWTSISNDKTEPKEEAKSPYSKESVIPAQQDWKKVEASTPIKQCTECPIQSTFGWYNEKADKFVCHNCGMNGIVYGNSVAETKEEQEIVNPMRLDKDGWEHVSQAFICHGCENKTHNGYQKYGTQLCEDCRTGMAEQDMKENIVKEESQSITNPPLRSIEDINEDMSY
jgi:regulator of replication initiation timing